MNEDYSLEQFTLFIDSQAIGIKDQGWLFWVLQSSLVGR